jgi:hypothetical protein
MAAVYVADGNTFQHREKLKAEGWVYHPAERVWTHRLPDTAQDEQRLRAWLKKLPGVSSYVEDGRRFGYCGGE